MSAVTLEPIDFNSGNSTPAFYYQSIQANKESDWLDKNNINDLLKIDLQSHSHPSEQKNDALNVEKDSAFEKRCDDRLILLARSYGENQASEDERAVLARIEMIESEIDSKIPRYDEEDWELLEEFKLSLEKLTEGK